MRRGGIDECVVDANYALPHPQSGPVADAPGIDRSDEMASSPFRVQIKSKLIRWAGLDLKQIVVIFLHFPGK